MPHSDHRKLLVSGRFGLFKVVRERTLKGIFSILSGRFGRRRRRYFDRCAAAGTEFCTVVQDGAAVRTKHHGYLLHIILHSISYPISPWQASFAKSTIKDNMLVPYAIYNTRLLDKINEEHFIER